MGGTAPCASQPRRSRRHRAGATNLPANLTQDGPRLLGSKFEGHGRTRRFGRIAEALLLVQVVDLDDNSINLITEFVAVFRVLIIESEKSLAAAPCGYRHLAILRDQGSRRFHPGNLPCSTARKW